MLFARGKPATRRLRAGVVATLLGFTMVPVIAAAPAYAAGCDATPDYVWTGATSDAWDVVGNWEDGSSQAVLSAPSPSDNVCIPNETLDPTITGGDAATAAELEIQTGAILTITADSLALGSDLDITGGSLITTGASTVTVGGVLNSSGTLAIEGTSTLTVDGVATLALNSNTTFDGGTIDFNDNLVTNDDVTWSKGNIDSTGFTVTNGGSWAISATGSLTATTFTNNGTVTKSGGVATTITADVANAATKAINVTAGTLNIDATKTFTQNGDVTIGDAILNRGSATYTQATTASLTIDDPDGQMTAATFNFVNGTAESEGELVGDVTANGAMVTSSGTITGDVEAKDGTLNASGTIDGDLDIEGGVVSIAGTSGIGELDVTGNFVHSYGTLEIELPDTGTAGVDYDLLDVAGTATLTGTSLFPEISLVTGTFDPADGDAFDVMEYTSVTDEYDASSGVTEDLPTGWEWDATYGTTKLTFTADAQPGTISGTVYVDEDGSGTKGSGETTGLEGIVVFVDTNDNGEMDSDETNFDETDIHGAYSLMAGPGTVNVAPVIEYPWMITDKAGTAGSVAVSPGAAVPNQHIGLFEGGVITGQVYGDTNGNETKDSTEVGAPNVTVYNDENGNDAKDDGEAETDTDSEGVYSFDLLEHGTYKLRIVLDSDGVQTTDDPTDINVVSGTEEHHIDFGVQKMVLTPQDPMTNGEGYWMVGVDGNVYPVGEDIEDFGNASELDLNAPVVGLAPTVSGAGYWLVGTDGGVFSFGDAEFHGSAGSLDLNEPVVGIAASPSGDGYWLVAADGGVFSYGDALFHGSAGSLDLNAPVVGIVPTPTGEGYWLVAEDGGVFSYGDAVYMGGMGGQKINAPVIGIGTAPGVDGYWLVAQDGGVFTFGEAEFHGSAGGEKLNAPIVNIRVVADGSGYWLFAADGGVFSYGSAEYLGNPMEDATDTIIG